MRSVRSTVNGPAAGRIGLVVPGFSADEDERMPEKHPPLKPREIDAAHAWWESNTRSTEDTERRRQQAELALAHKQLKRNQSLFKANAVSREALETSEAQVEVGEARAAALAAQIDAAQATYDGDVANLGPGNDADDLAAVKPGRKDLEPFVRFPPACVVACRGVESARLLDLPEEPGPDERSEQADDHDDDEDLEQREAAHAGTRNCDGPRCLCRRPGGRPSLRHSSHKSPPARSPCRISPQREPTPRAPRLRCAGNSRRSAMSTLVRCAALATALAAAMPASAAANVDVRFVLSAHWMKIGNAVRVAVRAPAIAEATAGRSGRVSGATIRWMTSLGSIRVNMSATRARTSVPCSTQSGDVSHHATNWSNDSIWTMRRPDLPDLMLLSIVGAAALHYLCRLGCRSPVLVERETLGSGSTGHCAGSAMRATRSRIFQDSIR